MWCLEHLGPLKSRITRFSGLALMAVIFTVIPDNRYIRECYGKTSLPNLF